MNKSISINLLLVTISLLAFNHLLFSQKLEPKERIIEPDHTIASIRMGRDYQLYISFPLQYSIKDTISYPVLYVLDGRRDFQVFQLTNRIMSGNGEIEDVIIVGISSGLDIPSILVNRSFDYTISVDTTVSHKTGGGEMFLECLKTDIIPFVDKHYKTNGNRGISGHSLGGLFTAYCFINSNGYFTRFGINSPSLWRGKILEEAVVLFTESKGWNIPRTKVFISAGGQESPTMMSNTVKFSAYLERGDYDNIDLSWQIFDYESHVSVIAASLSRTLSVLYRKE